MPVLRVLRERWLRLLTCLAVALVTCAVCPQAKATTVTPDPNYYLLTWDTSDGLPSLTVNAIGQSHDGFLWVATGNGLARFDGVQFKRFAPAHTTSPRDNNFTRLLVCSNGVIWVASESGLVLRFQDGQWWTLTLPPAWQNAKIVALAEDKHGALWVGAGLGVLRWQNGTFQIYDQSSGLPPEPVQTLIASPSGDIWLGVGTRYLVFQGESWQAPQISSVPEARIETFAHGLRDDLWMGISLPDPFFHGAHVLKLKQGAWSREFEPYPWLQGSPRSRIRSLMEDSAKTLWVGTTGDGVFFKPVGGDWLRLCPEALMSRLFISALFEDRDGTIWIGVEHGGLTQARRKIVKSLTLPEPGGERLITTVCASHDGSVWVGTDSAGVFRYRKGIFTHYETGSGPAAQSINAILEDSHTNVWAGTWAGLLRLNEGRFEPAPGPEALRKRIMTLFEDRAGDLWIGGVGELVWQRGQETRIYGSSNGLPKSDVLNMAEDPSGALWVAVRDSGLYRLLHGRFESFTNWPKAARQSIRSLHCDRDGTLWIGTLGEGLFRLQDGRFDQWTVQDGLPDNNLGGVIADGTGILWFNSENGLFGLRQQELADYLLQRGKSPLTCRHLSLEEGLATRIGSGAGQPIATESRDGQLWFPMGKTLAVFRPADLPSSRRPPAIFIEELWVDGVARQITPDRLAVAPSSAARIEFRFTAPQFLHADEVRFRYRLEGMDKDWVEGGTLRAASYSRLPPGNYRFYVMAGNSADGGWSETGQPLLLEIVPRFWQTRWFQLLCLAAFAMAVALSAWAVTRARARRRLRQLETQQAIERERRRIARDLHDDIGANVYQLVMLGDLAKRESASPSEVRKRVVSMVQKTRHLATALDETIWAVNPRNDSLAGLVNYLQHIAVEFFESSSTRLRLDIPANLPEIPLSVGVRHNLFLALKEALHNAASHSAAEEVWLRLAFSDSGLEVTISDDGCGFDPARVRSNSLGDGLDNMVARLRAIGGECVLESQPGQGCRVRFTLPLSKLTRTMDQQTRVSPEEMPALPPQDSA